jgi:signal transduction histidine kinase
VTLLRVAQEALANVAKHAGASRAGVTLSYMEDVVTLDVRDDGAGFARPPQRSGSSASGSSASGSSASGSKANGNPAGGFGLIAMRQRVDRLAGHGCSSARPRSRLMCCTSTPSSASTTGPPPWPPASSAACCPAPPRSD